MSKESAIKAVMMLASCYPSIKVTDQFVKMASTALEDYSDSTLTALCDPKTGIQMQNPNMPSISEMVKWVRGYTSTPQPPRYVSFPEPEPASPESKARIDSILASLPWANAGQAVKVTEEELQALKEKYATLPPPKFSDQALGALNRAREFEEKFGKRPRN